MRAGNQAVFNNDHVGQALESIMRLDLLEVNNLICSDHLVSPESISTDISNSFLHDQERLDYKTTRLE